MTEFKGIHGFIDRALGGPKARERIMEALDELAQRGTPEATGFQIAKTVTELHPPKMKSFGLMAYGTLYRALDILKEQGEVNCRQVTVKPSSQNDSGVRFFYHRVNRVL